MARRIYWTLLVLSVLGGGIISYTGVNFGSNNALIAVLTVLFMLFAASVHGIVAHSINPQKKGGLILYPLLMGVLFVLMFFFMVFFIMPLLYPNCM